MMDEISELKKYKDLLDSGAITEEEFTQLKQKLLGLKTDEEKEAERQAERAEALKEIDAMREAQKKKEAAAQKKQEEAGQKNQEEQAKANLEQQEQEEEIKSEPVQKEPLKADFEQLEQEAHESKEPETPSEENARAQERPTVEQKYEDAPRTDQSQQAKSASRSFGSVIKSVILWVVCIFLLFLAIPSLTIQNVYYVIFGIVALLLAILACPLITSRTKDIPALAAFYKIKVPVVVVLAILAFVFMCLAGSSVS